MPTLREWFEPAPGGRRRAGRHHGRRGSLLSVPATTVRRLNRPHFSATSRVLIAFNKPFGVICKFRPEPDRLRPRLSMDSGRRGVSQPPLLRAAGRTKKAKTGAARSL